MRTRLLRYTLFVWICLWLTTLNLAAVAQNSQAYRAKGLPAGVIVRLKEISHGDRVLAFAPNGEYIAIASRVGVWLYNVKKAHGLTQLGKSSDWKSPAHGVAFSPDSTKLVSVDERAVKLWDVSTRTNIATFGGHRHQLRSIAFSPDGTKLASGSADGSIKLWDIATEKNIATLTGHTDTVWSLAFSPDGTKLASGSFDGTVKLWNVATGKIITIFIEHLSEVRSVAFSPDGTKLASGAVDTTVKLWDVATGKNIATLGRADSETTTGRIFRHIARRVSKPTGHTSWVASVAFSPDGTKLASGSFDETIKLWDVATKKNITTFQGKRGRRIISVAFSPDGTKLVSASVFGTVLVWHLEPANP